MESYNLKGLLSQDDSQEPYNDDGADEKMLPKTIPKEETKKGITDCALSKNEPNRERVEIYLEPPNEAPVKWQGLTKSDLEQLDPKWEHIRSLLYSLFWIVWLLMLLSAGFIVYTAPKCDAPPTRTWWEKGPLVELDENIPQDGLKILTDKGVTGAIIKWPEDAYVKFDETHSFFKSLKNLGDEDLQVIVEVEPRTSRLWFGKSECKDGEFDDYYIWKERTTTDNTTSWSYSTKRDQHYLTVSGLPQLNFANPKVVEEFTQVLRNFMVRGVGGVKLTGIPLADPAQLLNRWRGVVNNIREDAVFMVAQQLPNNISRDVDLPLQSLIPNVTAITATLNATFVDSNSWPLWKCGPLDYFNVVYFLLQGTPLIAMNTSISKQLWELRSNPVVLRGTSQYHSLENGSILALVREAPGHPGLVLVFNPSNVNTVVDISSVIKTESETLTMEYFISSDKQADQHLDTKIYPNKVRALPESALLLAYVPEGSKLARLQHRLQV